MRAIPTLQPRKTPGADVEPLEGGGWRLTIPKGGADAYRLAQVDDYDALPRRALPWRPPAALRLRARVSSHDLPGTWGFGFWNDPFGTSLGIRGAGRRLPTVPNCAWFFYASPENYLALQDTHPASGFLAATFSGPRVPRFLLAAGVALLPALAVPPTARLARRLAAVAIGEDAARVETDPTAWHAYEVDWRADRVTFRVDGTSVWRTDVAPQAPAGLVLWVDNQYAAFNPQGRLRFGTLAADEAAWLELEDVHLLRP